MKIPKLYIQSHFIVFAIIVATIFVLWQKPELWLAGGRKFTTSSRQYDTAHSCLYIPGDSLFITLASTTHLPSTIVKYRSSSQGVLREYHLPGLRSQSFTGDRLSPLYYDETSNSVHTILNDSDNNYVFATLLKDGMVSSEIRTFFRHPLTTALHDTTYICKGLRFYPYANGDKTEITPYKDGYRLTIAKSQSRELRNINHTDIQADTLLTLISMSAVRQRLPISNYDAYKIIGFFSRNHYYNELYFRQQTFDQGFFPAIILGRTDSNYDGIRDYIVEICSQRWANDILLSYDALNDSIIWQREFANGLYGAAATMADIDGDGNCEIIIPSQAHCSEVPIDWFETPSYRDNTNAYFYILSEKGEFISYQNTPWVARHGPGFFSYKYLLTQDHSKILLAIASSGNTARKQIQYISLPEAQVVTLDASYTEASAFFEHDNQFYFYETLEGKFLRKTLNSKLEVIDLWTLPDEEQNTSFCPNTVTLFGKPYVLKSNGTLYGFDKSITRLDQTLHLRGDYFTVGNSLYYIDSQPQEDLFCRLTFKPNHQINPYTIIFLLLEGILIGTYLHLKTSFQTPMVSPQENFIFLYIVFGRLHIWKVIGSLASQISLPKKISISNRENQNVISELAAKMPVITKRLNLFTTLKIFPIPSLDYLTVIQRIAHNIKNELLVLKFETDELAAGSSGDSISTITQHLQTISDHARTLSDFSRISQINLEHLDITEILESTIVEFFNHPNFLFLHYDFSQPLYVDADEKLLHTALRNLIHNALDAVEPQQDIAVSVHEENQNIIITTENPTTLTETEMQHIGSIGYTTKPNGSGLGVSITRTICQRHGGQLMVSLRDGLFVATCILPKSTKGR